MQGNRKPGCVVTTLTKPLKSLLFFALVLMCGSAVISGLVLIAKAETGSFGKTSVGASNYDGAGVTALWGNKYSLAVPANLQSITAYVGRYQGNVTPGLIKYGVYNDTGANLAFLGQTEVVTFAGALSWVKADFDVPLELAAGDYFLTLLMDSPYIVAYDSGGNNSYLAPNSYPAFPSPWTGVFFYDYGVSIFANYTDYTGNEVHTISGQQDGIDFTFWNFSGSEDAPLLVCSPSAAGLLSDIPNATLVPEGYNVLGFNTTGYANYTDAILDHADKLRTLLTWVFDSSFPFAVDKDNVGTYGFSAGGGAVLAVNDSRVGAIVSVCAFNDGLGLNAYNNHPVLITGGSVDAIAPYATNQTAYYGTELAPKMLVEMDGVNHVKDAGIDYSIAWFDWLLKGSAEGLAFLNDVGNDAAVLAYEMSPSPMETFSYSASLSIISPTNSTLTVSNVTVQALFFTNGTVNFCLYEVFNGSTVIASGSFPAGNGSAVISGLVNGPSYHVTVAGNLTDGTAFSASVYFSVSLVSVPANVLTGYVVDLLFGEVWFIPLLLIAVVCIVLVKVEKFAAVIVIPCLLVLEGLYYAHNDSMGSLVWAMLCTLLLMFFIAAMSVLQHKRKKKED